MSTEQRSVPWLLVDGTAAVLAIGALAALGAVGEAVRLSRLHLFHRRDRAGKPKEGNPS